MGQFREHTADLKRLMDLRQTWLDNPGGPGRVESHEIRQEQRRLTPDEVDELVRAYRDGATLKALTNRFGVCRTTVSAHLERRGVPRRQSVGLSPEQVMEAARLYESGLSFAAVGQQLGFAGNTVRTYLMDAGVTIRPRRGYS
jgi:DNA-binding NarL/FixJ family response regulator